MLRPAPIHQRRHYRQRGRQKKLACGNQLALQLKVSHQHGSREHGAFADAARCADFRKELAELQSKLRQYTKMLADMAGVEDLTNLEGQ